MRKNVVTATVTQLNRIARIALSISLISAFLAILPTFADTPVAPTQAQTSTCGARVSNYNYRVPFEGSPWNTPICDVVPYNNDINQGKDYGSRIFQYGNTWNAGGDYWTAEKIPAQKGKFMTQFGLNGDQNDYSTPIYHITPEIKAKGNVKQFKICNAVSCLPSNLDDKNCWNREDIKCMAPDTGIPWDPSWRPSGSTDGDPANDANDKEMIIVDDATGQMYGTWMYDDGGWSCALGRTLWYALMGKSPETRQCVGSAGTTYDASGKPANYYTYNQGVASERGMGIQNAAMIVTPEEVQAGEIRHALTMEAFNTMGGTVCSDAQLAANNPNVVGKTCGFAVAPATRVEFADAVDVSRVVQGATAGSCTDMADKVADPVSGKTFRQLLTIDKLVPEGMRFKLTWSEAQIDKWLDGKAKTDSSYAVGSAKRKTARIFAIALKDYGWIVGDTTCAGAGFTTAGAANPDAKAKWASVGIKDSSSQMLLEGLFTADNIIAVDPPVTKCVDGKTTKMFCPWMSSSYQASQFSNSQVPVTTSSPPIVVTTQLPSTSTPLTVAPTQPVTTKLPTTNVTTTQPLTTSTTPNTQATTTKVSTTSTSLVSSTQVTTTQVESTTTKVVTSTTNVDVSTTLLQADNTSPTSMAPSTVLNTLTEPSSTLSQVSVAGQSQSRSTSTSSESTLPFTGSSSRSLSIVAITSMLIGLAAITISKKQKMMPLRIKTKNRQAK